MRKTRLVALMGMALACLLVVGMHTTVSAQGRGGGAGRGAGNPGSGGPGMGGRPTGSPGVNRGIGTASERSGGRSDRGLGTASERSGGRSDQGIERARAGRDNSSIRDGGNRAEDAERADRELNRYQGLAERLGTTPEELRDRYVAARALNPDLNFGRFVAANVIANNLSAAHPQITAEAILSGLNNGRSIGQTLRDLGLSSSEAREVERSARRQIEATRRRS